MNITVKSYRETRAIATALPCGVPGLAINPDETRPALFAITHVRSGLSVAFFTCPEAALAAAQDLGELLPGGWTLSADDIADEISKGEVADVISPWGGTFGYPAGDRSDVAVVAS